ncbi:DUF47 family protein [Rhodocyclus tenuis]|uniref:DUF47 family protein n=2 Tax=Rhodocyclus TaxID=1064 RepID=A0A6L5JUE1_RHOTE|nr:DUF47 family protein [Rhodocyclus gracilis]MQY50442.1 DUF47 family protein [Rhodocyclus gracilis]MRD71661.1 DUF47 family protein [Rhodocyclus gracilis]NJA87945.1 DUF47 family protein [Rhodocyclus gracilis]
MFGRLLPQEGKFFDLFNAHADQIMLGAQALVALLASLNKADGEAAKHFELIDAAENRADRITHETMALLHKTFITPLDRDEIHKLINCLDDILDLVKNAGQVLTLYDIRRTTPEATHLAEIIVSSCDRVRYAVSLLPSMDNGTAILKTCEEIDRLESDADRVMRGAMSRLFRDEPDVRQLIKLKAIYELLETVTDRCEDAANIIEGIVLENS